MKQYNVGIFLFNDVEVLDFAGPFEVFSVTRLEDDSQPFNVTTVSEDGGMVRARNGLHVQPDFSFADAPEDYDILIVPGGIGATQEVVHNERALSWIRDRREKTPTLASVCTGAYLLAEAGLLSGHRATTHWAYFDEFEVKYPGTALVRDVKFVDEGALLTSGGISAGINMSFHIVARLFGTGVARKTAERMEYDIEI
ncbi:DJ-1/PfpI family protein [Alteribacter natronophilus]|uniref:DJ-1/PfpI family protein n=1 Tax=Alteribacter natronophilus TaxID=2583810 RepID=UPI00110D74BA|nr:DJ-1/PfpI family protein [Alteribacter natronophilus]TMW70897.1 DJ-1/PfpI family protein [Alteribacter natronophilus]